MGTEAPMGRGVNESVCDSVLRWDERDGMGSASGWKDGDGAGEWGPRPPWREV